MDQAIQFIIEMHESIWKGFNTLLQDVTPEEANWRPLPQANSINLILRHLLIEAQEHLAKIEHAAQNVEQPAGSIPLDFERNVKELEGKFTGFIAALRRSSLAELEQRSAAAYQGAPSGRIRPPHFLAFHQVMHLAMHMGQISTIRNLYCKTRGLPARFFPVNPSFPT